MKQQQFEKLYESKWKKLEALFSGTNKNIIQMDSAQDFPQQYREVCQHLALARDRHYSPRLVERLEQLSLNGHQLLYGASGGTRIRFVHYFMVDFPKRVRREWKLVALSTLLFFGTFFLMMFLVHQHPHLPYKILGDGQVRRMEEMYDPAAAHFGRQRDAGSDIQMWGYYINNNIGIDFRCFAMGAFVGIGSIFCMLFNGIVIGTVAGHLTEVGYGSTFWPFVAGHSALELIACVFAGAAGMKMGFALLSPGRKTRSHAFLDGAKEGIKLLYGTAFMTFLAAFVEAFWSSRADISSPIKFTVGAFFWVALILYFTFCGRRHAA